MPCARRLRERRTTGLRETAIQGTAGAAVHRVHAIPDVSMRVHRIQETNRGIQAMRAKTSREQSEHGSHGGDG